MLGQGSQNAPMSGSHSALARLEDYLQSHDGASAQHAPARQPAPPAARAAPVVQRPGGRSACAGAAHERSAHHAAHGGGGGRDARETAPHSGARRVLGDYNGLARRGARTGEGAFAAANVPPSVSGGEGVQGAFSLLPSAKLDRLLQSAAEPPPGSIGTYTLGAADSTPLASQLDACVSACGPSTPAAAAGAHNVEACAPHEEGWGSAPAARAAAPDVFADADPPSIRWIDDGQIWLEPPADAPAAPRADAHARRGANGHAAQVATVALAAAAMREQAYASYDMSGLAPTQPAQPAAGMWAPPYEGARHGSGGARGAQEGRSAEQSVHAADGAGFPRPRTFFVRDAPPLPQHPEALGAAPSGAPTPALAARAPQLSGESCSALASALASRTVHEAVQDMYRAMGAGCSAHGGASARAAPPPPSAPLVPAVRPLHIAASGFPGARAREAPVARAEAEPRAAHAHGVSAAGAASRSASARPASAAASAAPLASPRARASNAHADARTRQWYLLFHSSASVSSRAERVPWARWPAVQSWVHARRKKRVLRRRPLVANGRGRGFVSALTPIEDDDADATEAHAPLAGACAQQAHAAAPVAEDGAEEEGAAAADLAPLAHTRADGAVPPHASAEAGAVGGETEAAAARAADAEPVLTRSSAERAPPAAPPSAAPAMAAAGPPGAHSTAPAMPTRADDGLLRMLAAAPPPSPDAPTAVPTGFPAIEPASLIEAARSDAPAAAAMPPPPAATASLEAAPAVVARDARAQPESLPALGRALAQAAGPASTSPGPSASVAETPAAAAGHAPAGTTPSPADTPPEHGGGDARARRAEAFGRWLTLGAAMRRRRAVLAAARAVLRDTAPRGRTGAVVRRAWRQLGAALRRARLRAAAPAPAAARPKQRSAAAVARLLPQADGQTSVVSRALASAAGSAGESAHPARATAGARAAGTPLERPAPQRTPQRAQRAQRAQPLIPAPSAAADARALIAPRVSRAVSAGERRARPAVQAGLRAGARRVRIAPPSGAADLGSGSASPAGRAPPLLESPAEESGLLLSPRPASSPASSTAAARMLPLWGEAAARADGAAHAHANEGGAASSAVPAKLPLLHARVPAPAPGVGARARARQAKLELALVAAEHRQLARGGALGRACRGARADTACGNVVAAVAAAAAAMSSVPPSVAAAAVAAEPLLVLGRRPVAAAAGSAWLQPQPPPSAGAHAPTPPPGGPSGAEEGAAAARRHRRHRRLRVPSGELADALQAQADGGAAADEPAAQELAERTARAQGAHRPAARPQATPPRLDDALPPRPPGPAPSSPARHSRSSAPSSPPTPPRRASRAPLQPVHHTNASAAQPEPSRPRAAPSGTKGGELRAARAADARRSADAGVAAASADEAAAHGGGAPGAGSAEDASSVDELKAQLGRLQRFLAHPPPALAEFAAGAAAVAKASCGSAATDARPHERRQGPRQQLQAS